MAVRMSTPPLSDLTRRVAPLFFLFAFSLGIARTANAADATGSPLFFESSMNTARYSHASVLLADGRVMVIGGVDRREDPLRSCEIFDPTTKRWTPTGNLQVNRWPIPPRFSFPNGPSFTATRLLDGRVLVTGGIAPTSLALHDRAEVWSPETGTWQVLPERMQQLRANHSAVLLGDGRVFLSGGQDFSALLIQNEVFDPETDTFIPVGSPASISLNRRNHQTLFVPTPGDPTQGHVLIFGGLDAAVFETEDTVDAFDPQADPRLSYQELPPMITPRFNFGIAYLGNTGPIALLAGGRNDDGSLIQCELLVRDGSGQLSFVPVGSYRRTRSFPKLVAVGSTSSPFVLSLGGRGSAGTRDVMRFDLDSRVWSETGRNLSVNTMFHDVVRNPRTNQIFITGGTENAESIPLPTLTSLIHSGSIGLRLDPGGEDTEAKVSAGGTLTIDAYLGNLTEGDAIFRSARLEIDRPQALGLTSALLGSRDDFELRNGRERQRELRIQVPAQAVPGFYSLAVTVQLSNGTILSEGMSFEVESSR